MKNSKIFAIIASFLGLSSLTTKDGRVELTEEQQRKVEGTFGKEFLDALLAADADKDAASDIFNQMVKSASDKDAEIARLRAEKAQLQQSVHALAKEPEADVQPAEVAAAPAKGTFAINPSAKHNLLAARALSNGYAAVFADAAGSQPSIDVSELNAELTGAMPKGYKLEILAQRIYNGFTDAKYFVKENTNTDYKATAAIITEVSQQFTPKWTPKGSGKFTPLTIKYRRHKINVLLQPADILNSWLTYLWEQGKTNAEMPIVRYMIEQHILPKVADDITLSMVGKGKFVDHSAGVTDGAAGSAAKDSMDGIETILVDGLSDADCKINYFKNAINIFDSSVTDAQVIAYVDSFVDALSPLFAKHLVLHCSPEFLTRYKRADFAVNGKYTGDENNGKIRFTSFTLEPMESLYSSPILFATPRENMAMLVDLSKAESCINKIEEVNYDVKVFGEYSLAVGFKIQEAVYAAVPSGYDPGAAIATKASEYSDAWKNGGASADDADDSGDDESAESA